MPYREDNIVSDLLGDLFVDLRSCYKAQEIFLVLYQHWLKRQVDGIAKQKHQRNDNQTSPLSQMLRMSQVKVALNVIVDLRCG